MVNTVHPPLKPRFWEEKSLSDMSREEWEALCDGCGRCCVVLLEDEDAPPATYLETKACCRLFDPTTRGCTDYAHRFTRVPGCVKVTPENAATLQWMPESCAYRRLAEGRGLADWHPLISGRSESVAQAGIAVAPDLVNETLIPEDALWEYVTGVRET